MRTTRSTDMSILEDWQILKNPGKGRLLEAMSQVRESERDRVIKRLQKRLQKFHKNDAWSAGLHYAIHVIQIMETRGRFE